MQDRRIGGWDYESTGGWEKRKYTMLLEDMKFTILWEKRKYTIL